MVIINPVPLPPFGGSSYTNITPFTYRDGLTYLEVLEALRAYIRDVLVPLINEGFDGLEDYVDNAVAELSTWVTAQIEISNEWTAEQIALLEAYVNEQVALIIENSITVQDPVMAGIMGNAGSATRIVTDLLYASKGLEVTVAGIPAQIDIATSLAQPSTYRLDTLPDAVKEFVSINERTYQRSAVAPGPESGDYYVVYFDKYHNPVIARYKSDERVFEKFNLSNVTNAPLRRTINDGHNSLSMFRDALGYLYVAGNLHGNQLVILKSRTPDSMREWAPMNLSSLTCDTASYPAFVALNDGSCLIQWRNGGASESGTWYFARMLENGVIGAQIAVFAGASDSAYPNQVQVDSTGRIHVFYMWRTGFNAHFGYVRTDNNFGTVQTMSGANVPLPITSANIDPYIITGNHTYINQCGAAIDPVTNFPHAVLRTTTGNYRIDHIYWNGSTWITEPVHTGVGNGVGRPGAFATADGRIYTAFRNGNRVAACKIWPQVESMEVIAPYAVGGPEAGWELAFDEQYLKSDDRLRFFISPVSSDASNTANNTMKEGTWGGVWSMSVSETAIKSGGEKAGISAPATPMAPATVNVQDRQIEPGNILRNNIGNRWIVPSGPRAVTASLVQDRVYATTHEFECSGFIDSLAVRVDNAGVAATVKAYIFQESALSTARPILAESAEITVTAGALLIPLNAPLYVKAGNGLSLNHYFIGLRFRYTTVPVLKANAIPDRSIQASLAADVVNEPRSGWVTTSNVADGATEIGALGGAYLAPLISVHTMNFS